VSGVRELCRQVHASSGEAGRAGGECKEGVSE
jgi:hypothetical protein